MDQRDEAQVFIVGVVDVIGYEKVRIGYEERTARVFMGGAVVTSSMEKVEPKRGRSRMVKLPDFGVFLLAKSLSLTYLLS